MNWSDWQYNPHTIPQVLIGLLCLWVSYVAWRRRTFPAAIPFSIMIFATAGWTLLNALEKSLVDRDMRWFLSTLIYGFIFTTPAAWFVFGVRYSRRNEWLPSKAVPLLTIMPVSMCLIAWTDSYHGLFRKSFEIGTEHSLAVEVITRGPLFYVNLVYCYALFLLGAVFVVDGIRKRPDRSPLRFAVMLGAMLVPVLGNLAYVVGWQAAQYIDYTPVCFAITGLAAAWMLFEFRIFNVLPIARDFVFDCMRDAILVLDERWRILDLNAAATALLPNPSTPVRNRLLAEVFPQLGPYLHRSGNPQGSTEFRFNVGGDERTFDAHILPMKDNGRTVGLLVRLCDVTERQRAEDERRRMERNLRHTQKLESLGMLAGGIAHDFNNLLAVILGNAELARLEIGDGSRAIPSIQNVVTAAERAAALANQMLAYSGKGRFVVEKLYVTPLIAQIHELLQSAVPKPIELECDLASSLPPILGDANQLRQLLLNLVTNAAESIGPQKGTVCIRTRLAEVREEDLSRAVISAGIAPGQHVLIQVTDTGAGIEATMIPRIFEPFFSTKFTGRGLGLAVVLGIVRGHGGAIFVESQHGVGTDFRILLPAVSVAATSPVAEPERFTSRSLPKGNHEAILLVDDEEEVRKVALRILEKAGYSVIIARDGGEALEIFRSRSSEIDAVLLDLTMPIMTGDKVLARMREIDPDVAVILTSGYEEDAVFRQLYGKEPAGFLRKPYRVKELIEKMRFAVSTRQNPKSLKKSDEAKP